MDPCVLCAHPVDPADAVFHFPTCSTCPVHTGCLNNRSLLSSTKPQLAELCPVHGCVVCHSRVEINQQKRGPINICGCVHCGACDPTFCLEHSCRVCKMGLIATRYIRLSCGCAAHCDCQLPPPLCGTNCPFGNCHYTLTKTELAEHWYNGILRGLSTAVSGYTHSRSNLFHRSRIIKDASDTSTTAAQILDGSARPKAVLLRTKHDLKQMGATIQDLIRFEFTLDDLLLLGLTWSELRASPFQMSRQHLLLPMFRDTAKLQEIPFGPHHPCTPRLWLDIFALSPKFWLVNEARTIMELVPFGFNMDHFVESGFTSEDFILAPLRRSEWVTLFGFKDSDLGLGRLSFTGAEKQRLAEFREGWNDVSLDEMIKTPVAVRTAAKILAEPMAARVVVQPATIHAETEDDYEDDDGSTTVQTNTAYAFSVTPNVFTGENIVEGI